MPRFGSRALPIAIALAALDTVGALVLRVTDLATGADFNATALFPLLFAGAGLCAAALLRLRSPAGSWLATVATAGLAAIEVVGVVRASQASARLQDWPWLVAGADTALVVAAGIAAAYGVRARASGFRGAGDPEDAGGVGAGSGRGTARMIAWRIAVLGGGAVVVGFAGWAVTAAFGGVAVAIAPNAAAIDVWPLRASGRVAAGFIALATLGGVVRDFAGPAQRAWTKAPGMREFPRALADELLPTSAAMRHRGEEDERARLAADLHARLLPDLRRAADAAAAAGPASDSVAIGLRQAVEDVEQLMHARQSVVLEEYGLVAALEWLAERTEQRTPLQVELELDGAGVDDAAALPRPIGRATFRVALLAIDNVVRHAQASRAVIRVQVEPGGLRMTITDDGRGIDIGAAGRPGGRGLTDIRAAAAEVGAAVRVEGAAPGTRIELRWTRPEPK